MKVVRRLSAHPVVYGGEVHSGWLPNGAAQPQPTPVEHVLLDFIIRSDGHGYFLEWCSDDGRHRGDAWHATLDEALQQAEATFGIAPQQWREAIE